MLKAPFKKEFRCGKKGDVIYFNYASDTDPYWTLDEEKNILTMRDVGELVEFSLSIDPELIPESGMVCIKNHMHPDKHKIVTLIGELVTKESRQRELANLYARIGEASARQSNEDLAIKSGLITVHDILRRPHYASASQITAQYESKKIQFDKLPKDMLPDELLCKWSWRNLIEKL